MQKWLVLLTFVSNLALAEGGEPPVRLTFEVQSASKATLLSGDLALQPNRATSMERHAAAGPERQSLSLELSPLEGGGLLVQATWSDVTPDGATIRWEPAFIIRRGGDASVRLDFPGGARVLRLTAS
ncbi:MAG: hypothetical protein INH41_05675 [Myxococcaceae bacterium]|jgi:hypothetical protein|nr:hypothetical protein [Myxococcaceae bacterium]MCA3011875.1 hypothetical protein [Myxococcaceae bacterium]